MEFDSDIAIIGGGPAGLAAANRAAERGLDATLFEKQYEIGYPVRTSGGSYISDMEKFKIPSKYYNPIRKVVFGTLKTYTEFSYGADTACVLDTRSIYQYLALEAAKKGCKIQVGGDVKDILLNKNKVVGLKVGRSNKEICFASKMVIDCSGFASLSARKLGMLGTAGARFGSGVEYEAYVERFDKHTAMLFVGADISPTGYVWVFPLSDNKVRIGVGLTKPDSKVSPLPLLDKLISERPGIFKDMGRISPIELHSGVVPIEPIPNKVTADGLIIVGDAAGQANPIVGEGIRPAIKFGYLAAEVSSEAIEKGDVSRKSLQAYEKEAKKIAGYNKIALTIQRKMAAYSDKDWDEALQKLENLSKKDFLNLLKADFSRRNMFRILTKIPSLLLK
ncbi:MAG TPA: NAD(P)/FAD-dependent oxidoreductase [Candidatus Acidoferrum sp.]|nr:NAD(P)/FAD-dependent oxidoreductase [Candidatus Acidoferrum sp.]